MKLSFDTIDHVHFLRERNKKKKQECYHSNKHILLSIGWLVKVLSMPRIRTSSSTPETRRRELLLLKSSSIDGRIKLAVEEAKLVVRNSFESESKQRLSYAEEKIHSDFFECSTIFPPIHRASATILFDTNGEEIQHRARVSSTIEGLINPSQTLSSSSIYHVELVESDEDEGEPRQARFISCLNLEPNYIYFSRRRRTSSLPNSTITIDLSNSIKIEDHRSSSLIDLTLWQEHPQKILPLFNRKYHFQPISNFTDEKFLLANDYSNRCL